jgi:imidazole glycerol-phosphate synthase subunit HisH
MSLERGHRGPRDCAVRGRGMSTIIVDHGRSNLFSLRHALDHLGIAHDASAEPGRIAVATRVFLPGVGAFGDVMRAIRDRGLLVPLRTAIARRVPLLGICVGMQILAEASEEFGRHEGLGVLGGTVRRLTDPPTGTRGIRVPNVGWRTLTVRPRTTLFADLSPNTMTYFVHSYALEPAHLTDVEATIEVNERSVPAIVRRGSVMGYQFHPEKSGPAGLSLIRRFMSLQPGAN